MTYDDFKLNFRETYKVGKDQDGKALEKHESVLDREFNSYPPEKLSTVWKAVRRHHKTTWYPSIGQILECMDKDNVSEFSFSASKDVMWNMCKTCGCHYSLKARVCPNCNRNTSDHEIIYNEVIIRKGDRYVDTHVTCHEDCPICPIFKANRNVRGAKCIAWGKDEHEKAGMKCSDCPCRHCCEGDNATVEIEIGEIMSFVKSYDFIDPHWIKFYEKHEKFNGSIKIGTIIKYAGNYYENKTEQDTNNWNCKGRFLMEVVSDCVKRVK